MIKIDNLGYQTDFIARKLDGEFIKKDSYIVARMPRNPTFHWGNLLIFKNEPQEGDFDLWISAHMDEFGEHSGHVTFGWESQKVGCIDKFVQNGFKLQSESVLVLKKLIQSRISRESLNIRKIDTDQDWEAVLELQIHVSGGSSPSKEYVEFLTRGFETYRKLSEEGWGDWWGAFLDDTLVGDMGLYFDDQFETGRFQSVETHPDYRRAGICSELLHSVASDALGRHSNVKLVICAEHESNAEKVYFKLGFSSDQLQHGVCLPSPLKLGSKH